MRKSHPNFRQSKKLNSSSNPNPSFDHHDSAGEPPALSAIAVSDDESSFSRRPTGPDRVSAGYVTYKISAYSKVELRELKRRLESELEQVRSVFGRIESQEIQPSARSGIYASGGGGAREVSSSAIRSGQGQFHHAPPRRVAANPVAEKALTAMMTKCKQILAKLMKQKGALWFNSPVDAKKLNLHDYHQIVKNPMDLGTVRLHLNHGQYAGPMDFAAEVRRTFDNALLYNPKGHVVHDLAAKFLRNFDNEFGLAYQKYEKQLAVIAREEDERQRMASWSRVPLPESPSRVHQVQEFSPLRPDPVPQFSPPRQVMAPVEVPERTSDHVSMLLQQQPQKPVMGRMPKPKARDLEKRVMSIEEKERLSEGLQSLPQEKMEQVLQIVKKRSGELVQDGDEIELDFEAMDTETLWELDRFVSNCRKMMSKIRRHDVMTATDMGSTPGDRDQQPQNSGEALNVVTPAAKRPKRDDVGDEEVVDIGDDEMPVRNYPSVEIDKDNASSGSDSSSSSSSGSDSDSSSSDSDGEGEAQSPAVGSRSSP